MRDIRSKSSRFELSGFVAAALLSASLGLYMLYDGGGLHRGSGPVVVAGLASR